jgi:predicted PurR-regulated permease PerM
VDSFADIARRARGPETSSHLLIWVGVAVALLHQLVAAVLAGFLVHALVVRVASGLSPRFLRPQRARPAALAVVLLVVFGGLTLAGGWTLHFAADIDLSRVLPQLVETLSRLRLDLPEFVLVYLPASPEELRDSVVGALKAHGQSLSALGLEGLAGTLHVLWGVVIGAIVSQANFAPVTAYRPLSAALLLRLLRLNAMFEKVVFAQVRISLLNMLLTAVYLLVILPLAGVYLPLAKTLVLLTFVVGLLPVLGNLLSNSVIVVISLGVSLNVAAASLLFLVLVHKLEYFLNARIIGHSVNASIWEMLLAMFLLEGLFGLPGLVAAPVLYAYLKYELLAAGLVGSVKPEPA